MLSSATISSMTVPGWPTASETACGPSTRKRRALWRSFRRNRRRAERSIAWEAAGSSDSWISGGRRVGGRRIRLGHLNQSFEGGGVGHSKIGKDLAVDLNSGSLEAGDEAVVGHTFGTGSRIDPLDPQLAEITLASAAVAVGIYQRMGDLLLGFPVQPRTLPTVTGRLPQNLTALLLCIDGALDACHRS